MKASLTPSNNPYSCVFVWMAACVFVCVGRTEKPETAAVVDVRMIAVVVFIVIFLLEYYGLDASGFVDVEKVRVVLQSAIYLGVLKLEGGRRKFLCWL